MIETLGKKKETLDKASEKMIEDINKEVSKIHYEYKRD
jgi:hypothetical protein